MTRRYLVLVTLIIIACAGALVWSFWPVGNGGDTADYPEPPRSVEISDRAAVTGMRAGQAIAIVDLMELAPVLAPLAEADIDRLVRSALQQKATAWFSGERFGSVASITVDVVTIAEHDEYQRPDPNSALAHGRLTIANSGGTAGQPDGTLSFDNLRERKDRFVQMAPPQDQQSEPAADAEIPVIPEISDEQMAEAEEQIVFDELDIWHHPRSLSNTYPSFEPVRVRTDGAQYFFRNDTRSERFAAVGRRYGEVALTNNAGSVMYLPQYLDFTGTVGFTVRLRKSEPQMRASLRIYLDATTFATLTEGDRGFPLIEDTQWHRVSVPFSAFKFERPGAEPTADRTWTKAADFLTAYEAPAGFVFAIELEAETANGQGSLFFDRLSVLRAPDERPEGMLSGRLDPPQPGILVHVRTAAGEDQQLAADEDGRFETTLPNGSRIVEINAAEGLSLFAPRTGIYLEVGAHLPEIVIPVIAEDGDNYPIDQAVNSATYVYDAPIGARIAPESHFGTSRKTGDDIQFFLEQRTNSFGFIDRDRRLDNPDHAYRIVVIGDSYYMGIYNDMRDAVWNQAEARAAVSLDRPVEIIPATHHHAPFINSWSQFTEYALKLEPDMVILSVIHPEILNFGMEEYVRRWLGFGPGHPPSAIFRLDENDRLQMTPFDPEWQTYKKPLTEDEKAEVSAHVDTNQYVRTDLGAAPDWIHRNLKTVTAALARFGEEARRRGVELALGYSAFEGNMARMHRNTDLDIDPSLFRSRMQALAQEAGITFLDLSETIYEGHTEEDNLYIPKDGHWSSYAHYRAGKAIFEVVEERIGSDGAR